ncbi:MAG: winged helix-turn-helix domain-containing protein [Desulfobacterales bacterium]|nr:winged helix-turn-helix domain-containing protein [Desulfobacterales bacterium]
MDAEGKKRILLVEDDLRLAALVSEYLGKQEYEMEVEHNGDKAVQKIIQGKPDLVILDLMLPGKDGFSICRDVRHSYKGPILILTAREDDMDQVVGLELGADDYVKKPVEPRVLLARIRALFRRSLPAAGPEQLTELRFGELFLCSSSRNVTLGEEAVDLSTTEFDLLWLLASKAGEVLDRDLLCQTVKGVEYDGIDRSIDVAVSRLRKKLKDNPEHPDRIKTVWGSGYLFVSDAWNKS